MPTLRRLEARRGDRSINTRGRRFFAGLVGREVMTCSGRRARHVWQRARRSSGAWHYANGRRPRRRCSQRGHAPSRRCPALLRRTHETGRAGAQMGQATRRLRRASVSSVPTETFCQTSPETRPTRPEMSKFYYDRLKTSRRAPLRRSVGGLWPLICSLTLQARAGRREPNIRELFIPLVRLM